MNKLERETCNIIEAEEAARYEEIALSHLKSLGLRITRPRKLVLKVLASTRKPLGAYQIRDYVLSQGQKIDVVSVYRILASLVEAGLAHHVGLVDGYLACTSAERGKHQTEHLVCRKCGCVEEIPVPNPAFSEISASASRQGFLLESTRIEVAGTCSHCR
ncbi:MAG TPA: Fur family transcriptional regulator [Fimbriimonadales bacterium]|nr:Fur family transcriptional regulator [Fimbriimonadales bacterium]